jgi:hypothetical protein
MKHLFPRRGISFLEQVPHRLVPVSFDLALSHPGARSVDALRNCLQLSPVALIVTATLAFTTTAPVASLTDPTMSDVVIWPNACCPARKQTLKPLTQNAASIIIARGSRLLRLAVSDRWFFIPCRLLYHSGEMLRGECKMRVPSHPLFSKIFCVQRKPCCGRRPRSTTR